MLLDGFIILPRRLVDEALRYFLDNLLLPCTQCNLSTWYYNHDHGLWWAYVIQHKVIKMKEKPESEKPWPILSAVPRSEEALTGISLIGI